MAVLDLGEREYVRDEQGRFAETGASSVPRDPHGTLLNKQGAPLVVYHGSVSRDVPVTELDPTRPPVRPRPGQLNGLYFTSDPQAASSYTRVSRLIRPRAPGEKAVVGRVLAAHLTMHHPLDITPLIKVGQAKGLTFADAKREALQSVTPAHDGTVFHGDDYNADEYLVFSPKQIRPATKHLSFDLYSEDQPRDEGGRWTDGATAAGLPSGMTLHPIGAGSVIDALAERRWNIEATPSKFSREAWDLKVEPKVVEGVAVMDDPRPGWRGEKVFYDTRLAEVKDGQVVAKPPEGWTTDAPAQREAGALYRGMRYEEYQHILKTGEIGAKGEYNIGQEQEGLTFFSVDPAQAQTYASGFAPWQHGATFDKPAIIVKVKDPGTAADLKGLSAGTDERGIPGRVKASAITEVYVGRPYRMRPGEVELYQTYDPKTRSAVWTEGSRSSPSSWLLWKKVEPGTAGLELRAHHYRMGFCLTCRTVASACERVFDLAEWNETDHPRDDAGKFADAGGSRGPQAAQSDTGGRSTGGVGVSPSSAAGGAKAPARPDADPEAHRVADAYNEAHGLPPVVHGYATVDEPRAGEIADAYDALPVDDHNNPAVREAYTALAHEISAQWDHIVASGMTFEPWTKEGQPYQTSTEMAKDVKDHQHMFFFTGGEPNQFMAARDPKTGLSINDKFRAVHDYFGHAAGGYGFGPRGEENAWISHSQMLTPQARRALTTETRGQNSWVNFGRQNYNADGTHKNIPPADRPFAHQKTALLPDKYVLRPGETTLSLRAVWAWYFGLDWDEALHPRDEGGKFAEAGGGAGAAGRTSSPQFKGWFQQSQVVDEDGAPLTVYHGTTHDITEFKPAGAEGLNTESDWGAGVYFSSDPADASENYAGIGPDLKSRIENRAEQIESNAAVNDEGVAVITHQEAVMEATAELKGSNEGVIVPAFLSLQKPLVLGGPNGSSPIRETHFEKEYVYADPNDPDSDIIGEKGSLPDFLTALRDVASYETSGYHGGTDAIDKFADKVMEHDYISASQLLKLWKSTEETAYIEGVHGELVQSEVFRKALEKAGYDGVIDRTVYDKFGRGGFKRGQLGGMEHMTPDTTHFIAFHPAQIKSAIGNTTFDPKNPSLVLTADELRQFLLDKDEHGYGSYPRSERIEVNGRVITVKHSPRAAEIGDVLVPLDMPAFDQAWAKDTGFYIDPLGSNQIGKRTQEVHEFLKTSNELYASEVTVQNDGRVGFSNGRHRMAYLRDHGVTRIPVSMTKESLANAKKFGLLAKTTRHLSYLLDKDEHGYGSYPRGEHVTTVHGPGSSVQLPGRYDRTKIPKNTLAVTTKHGYILVTRSSSSPDYMWINHVWVADKARGQGEGTALHIAAMKAAQEKGFKGILRGDRLGHGVSDLAQATWASLGRKGLTEKVTETTTDPATGKPATYDTWALVRAEPTHLSYRERLLVLFDPNEPRDAHGQWTDSGGAEYYHSPKDAIESLLDRKPGQIHGQTVNIAKEDVRALLKVARERGIEDPNLLDVRVDGKRVFGDDLGIARDDMPQVPKAMRQHFLDEEIIKRGITISNEFVSPLSLKPTQTSVSARIAGDKLREYQDKPKKKFPPLLVDRDGRILDGHHHWGMMAALAIENPNIKIPIRRLNLSNKEALALMHQYDKRHGIKRKKVGELHADAIHRFMLIDLEWDEGQHPRDEGGKFTDSGEVPVQPGSTPIPKGMIRAYHYTNNGKAALDSILKEGLSTAHARGSTYGEPNVIWFSTTKPGDFKHYVEVNLKPEELQGGVGGPSMVVERDGHWRNAETPEERQEVLDKFNEAGSNFAIGVDRIPPSRIVTHSEPWMATYHQIVNPENPALKPLYAEKIQRIVEGKLDPMAVADPEKYGKVFAAIKAKFGKHLSSTYRERLRQFDLEWDESQHPREQDGKFTEAGSGGGETKATKTKSESHADKPSVKGKNIQSVHDTADDAVVEQVLGLDSEAKVRDLAESMVQYVDDEKFSITIETEGGGPSDDELQERYDEYSQRELEAARREWVDNRIDRQQEIIDIWHQRVLEEERSGPYGETVDNPTLPLPDDEFRPVEHGGIGGAAQVSFDDLTKDLDPTSAFSQEEKDTIAERLRGTGGPLLESTRMMRQAWQEEYGGDFEPNQSFGEWAGGRGSSRGDDELVRMRFEGSEGTTITREFKRDENGDVVVDHAYFKAQRTGGGMAKDLMRASFDEYQRLGIDKVTVHANIDVGGYAWAKFGFRTTEEGGSMDVDQLFRNAERNGRITHEERVMLEDVATEHEGEDTQLWAIADATHGDKKIGAAALLGSDWYGEIRLNDRRAMDRLRNYIAETKPAKAPGDAAAKGSAADTERANQVNIRSGEKTAIANTRADWIAEQSAKHPDRTVAELERAYDKDTVAKRDALIFERNRLINTARGTAAEEARLREIDTAIRQATRPAASMSRVEQDLAEARRHADEIQRGFDQWSGKTGRDAEEQRSALASQERTTAARIRTLEKQQRAQVSKANQRAKETVAQREAREGREQAAFKEARLVAEERAAQNANRERLGLAPLNFADDPPPPPSPETGSREMFYEDEQGNRADRDLWRDILGEDFPDDLPPQDSDPQSLRGLLQVRLDLYSDDQPRDEAGRWASTGTSEFAAAPRVFSTPADVKSYNSWGKTEYGWLDPKTGELSGQLLTGEPIPRETLPETLYHVTTNAPAVESSGVLLGQRAHAGLGGGQADGVSFTSSKEDARVIQRELTRSVRIARGDDLGMDAIERYAREDEHEAGLPTGTLDRAVASAREGYEGNKFLLDKTYVQGKGYTDTPLSDAERARIHASITKDALNAYLWGRDTVAEKGHPLLKNPILFGNQEKLKHLDPASIKTLTVPTKNIPAKALVTTGSDKFLHEVRVYADVPSGGSTAIRLRHYLEWDE